MASFALSIGSALPFITDALHIDGITAVAPPSRPLVSLTPVSFATYAGLVLAPGLWLLFAGLTNATVVTATEEAIAARTLFGRQRRLTWADITFAKRKKNQIILSPAGTDTVGQEIWDRRSVFLDIGTLDVAPGAMETLIARHRPDLVIPVTT